MIYQMSIKTQILRRDDIHRTIRREILNCEIAPGADLREADFAKRFIVSKSPVRDALLRLESERLVVVHPRKGYQAAPISLADAADLFDLRMIIEPACAREAAANAASADLAKLDFFRSLTLYHEFCSADARGDISFVDYNREFHTEIARLCQNKRLAGTSIELIEHFDRLVIVSLRQFSRQGPASLLVEHNKIIDALQSRNVRLVGKLVVNHIRRARARVMASLSQLAIVP